MTVTSLKSPDAAARWLRSWVTGTVTTDSRKLRAGDGFIAWPGAATDGRRFVANALQAGATTCLVEREGLEAFSFDDARIASLPGLKAATGPIADAFFEQPSRALEVVATTGTNGKTSTAWWTAQALTSLQRRCAFVGTLGIGVPPLPDRAAQIDFTGLTTPDPVMLHAALRLFADGGFKACAIEASSIGIVEQRLAALRIAVALFTNFTRDHLDYHGTMDAYWAAKRQLFAWPGLRAAVINIDDARGAALAGELLAGPLDVWTYSVRGEARLRAKNLAYVAGGLAFDLNEGEQAIAVRSTLIGDYNASNLLAVIGGLRALGVSLIDAASIVPQLTPVPGRMQRVMTAPRSPDTATTPPSGGEPGLGRPGARVRAGSGLPEVVVDYAHTPDALEKVLQALRPLAAARGGRLVCVFGCGGNRDATKRPLMGAIAERDADSVVVTSDNPRTEVPAAILADIVAGIVQRDRVQVIEDRREAIAQALAGADERDVVLIAGKGHEDYQEIRGVKQPFSDLAEAGRALAGEGAAMMSLAQAQALLPGSTLVGEGATLVQRVHSDTRTLRAGDLFVALKGERFDAHEMLAEAANKGAVAALAERGLVEAGLPGLQVANTQQALEQLAAAWRARLHLPLIAVTGSNGKTTVTQMIAAILRAGLGDGAFATEGNYNNHIGLPLTLLRLRQDDACWHRAGVVELGMNHPGEIALLARIAQPTIALVNNAQREHQEFMASVEAVARENGSAIEALGPAGTAVYPADDAHAPLWHQLAGARPQLTFALQGAADVTADALWVDDHWALVLHTPAGAASLTLRLAGRHNVKNALAAAACALAAGATLEAVKRGLESFEPVKGRSQMKAASLHGVRVALVDDSYNANPDSVRAAIDVLAAMPAPRLLLLGDMGEVGDRGPAYHAEVGACARERGIDHLWCAGTQSADAARAFGPEARHFADVESLLAARSELPAVASMLVKGSRFMQMERVVQALQETP